MCMCLSPLSELRRWRPIDRWPRAQVTHAAAKVRCQSVPSFALSLCFSQEQRQQQQEEKSSATNAKGKQHSHTQMHTQNLPTPQTKSKCDSAGCCCCCCCLSHLMCEALEVDSSISSSINHLLLLLSKSCASISLDVLLQRERCKHVVVGRQKAANLSDFKLARALIGARSV